MDNKFDKTLDLTKINPYGDTLNDGKVQISFTLPVEDDEKAVVAAKILVRKMGVKNPSVVYHCPLDKGFTYFIVYGSLNQTIDYTEIQVDVIDKVIMSREQINEYIKKNIKRKVIILGATTGTDAHTVGIDAIINRKGYKGHYGLESYEMIEAFNMGSQVQNEDFIKRAIELNADVMLVSQTVTQKDIHVKNLTNLVELLESEELRDKIILICGGPRITHELAKELGYDAGFGPNKYAEDVATFAIKEIVDRKKLEL